MGGMEDQTPRANTDAFDVVPNAEDALEECKLRLSLIKDESIKMPKATKRSITKRNSEILIPTTPSPREVLPDDILVLQERTIHGWVEKMSKNVGYFGTQWKRYFMICENFKLCYY